MKSLIVVVLLAVIYVCFVEGTFFGGNKGGSNMPKPIVINIGNNNNNNDCGGRVCGQSSENSTICRPFRTSCILRRFNTNNSPRYSIVSNNRCSGISYGNTGSC